MLPNIINHIKTDITRFFLFAIRFLLNCWGNDLNRTHLDEANIKICRGLLSYIFSKLTSFTEMFLVSIFTKLYFTSRYRIKLLNVPLVVFFLLKPVLDVYVDQSVPKGYYGEHCSQLDVCLLVNGCIQYLRVVMNNLRHYSSQNSIVFIRKKRPILVKTTNCFYMLVINDLLHKVGRFFSETVRYVFFII